LDGECTRHTDDEKYKISAENPVERTNLRPRSEYNIKIDLKEHVDGIHLSQDSIQWWAVLNTAVNLKGSGKMVNFLTS
jgi:hypothetical protein